MSFINKESELLKTIKEQEDALANSLEALRKLQDINRNGITCNCCKLFRSLLGYQTSIV